MLYDIEDTSIRIRELRKEYGLTQEELAVRLNVSDRHIRNLEGGKCGVSLDLLVAMSELFDVSLDYIILGRKHSENQLRKQLHTLMELLTEIDKELK